MLGLGKWRWCCFLIFHIIKGLRLQRFSSNQVGLAGIVMKDEALFGVKKVLVLQWIQRFLNVQWR